MKLIGVVNNTQGISTLYIVREGYRIVCGGKQRIFKELGINIDKVDKSNRVMQLKISDYYKFVKKITQNYKSFYWFDTNSYLLIGIREAAKSLCGYITRELLEISKKVKNQISNKGKEVERKYNKINQSKLFNRVNVINNTDKYPYKVTVCEVEDRTVRVNIEHTGIIANTRHEFSNLMKYLTSNYRIKALVNNFN